MIANHLTKYFQDLELKEIFSNVLGTSDVNDVQDKIFMLVKRYFNHDVTAVIFLESSIGIVFGLELSNNSKVVLKIFNPQIEKHYLQEINSIQGTFNAEKFPAPLVLTEIFDFYDTYAGFYEYINGDIRDAHIPIVRHELAKYLAEFVNIVEKYKFKPMVNFFQQQSDTNLLWPKPHNTLFNLEATNQGAGWIEDKAKEARRILLKQNQPLILAHTDWRVENVYFVSDKLTAVFDWDSLGSMSELELLGTAAAQFTTNFRLNIKVTPTPDEARAFISEYQQYRSRHFSAADQVIISAASDYKIAHIARLEHALNMHGEGQFQSLLRECGEISFLLC